MTERIDQAWLSSASLQGLLKLLSEDGGQARIAGGAVRNALLDQPISDVDIATTLIPSDVTERLVAAGHKCVATGIDHGTVTAIVDADSYEVTTLRQDVETDGRHAKVVYGTSWEADARRRDLTINALYLEADGTVVDPLGGMPDVLSGTVRFIDDAEMRIREDYLRILRFFRFFAWYGSFRPDAEGLKACARLKDGLEQLSAERIWLELSKLFDAPDPGRAVLWMRQTGVLSQVLPESEKWGIDAMPRLVEAERARHWPVDALIRLMAILPPMEERVSELSARLKLPNKVRDRLLRWSRTPEPNALMKKNAFFRWAYWQDQQAVLDRLQLVAVRGDENSKKYHRQYKWLMRWQRPGYPLRGRDLIAAGLEPGPDMAVQLKNLEQIWIDSDFALSREELLKQFAESDPKK